MASADEEVSEMRKVSSDKKKRNETKICSICFGNLNGSEKDGFCFICTKKPLNAKDKY